MRPSGKTVHLSMTAKITAALNLTVSPELFPVHHLISMSAALPAQAADPAAFPAEVPVASAVDPAAVLSKIAR